MFKNELRTSYLLEITNFQFSDKPNFLLTQTTFYKTAHNQKIVLIYLLLKINILYMTIIFTIANNYNVFINNKLIAIVQTFCWMDMLRILYTLINGHNK